MNSVSQDQVISRFHDLKGPVKQGAGKPGDNPKLEDEGSDEMTADNFQKRLDQFKKVLGTL